MKYCVNGGFQISSRTLCPIVIERGILSYHNAKGERIMPTKFQAGIINSWKVNNNSFPADRSFASSSIIASECEAKAVEVQS